jgi:hypothetical protein
MEVATLETDLRIEYRKLNKDENPVLFEQIFLAYARDIFPAVKDSASKKHRIC